MNGIRGTGVLALLVGILGLAPAVAAAGNRTRGDLAFQAETLFYPDSAGDPVTRLQLAFPAAGPDAGTRSGDAAPVVLHVLVIATAGEGGHAMTRRWTGDFTVGGVPPKGGGEAVPGHVEFMLPPGNAKLHVEVSEDGGGHRGEADLPVRVPAYRGAPLSVSDLIFGECGTDTSRARRAGSIGPVVPRPFRRYGDDTSAPCVLALVRDELPGLGDTIYAARWTIKDQKGRTRADSTAAVPRRGGSGTIVLHPSTGDLERGSYRLDLEVSLGGERVRAEGTFQVDESRIAFRHDALMLRTVLGYVATNSELREIDASPDDSLAALWTRFWDRRNPDPGSSTNPALIEFMNRVEYARRHYGVMEPGWRSDMGRTYIKFGPPDRVERTANGILGPATEIWYYDARNTAYVFQDRDGFGRYRLVGSRGN
jgi:GWxTD domain-containing protein